MEINSINNSPNFGARIVIQKTGFKNLGKDLIDSFESGSRTTGTVASTSAETTILPSDVAKGMPFGGKISKGLRKIEETIIRIFKRDIKTSEIEGIDVKDVASNSAVASSGASTISSGLGSYDAALASALDQSVNYPNSIYARSFPEFSVNHFPESILNHLDKIERSAYNQLWDPRLGAGNECASSASVAISGLGSSLQAVGFETLTKGRKAFENAEDIQRKLPS